MKSALSIIFMATASICFPGQVEPRLLLHPPAQPVSPSMTTMVATSLIAKVSWEAVPGQAYILETRPRLGSNDWLFFSIEEAVETPARRSVVMDQKSSFFRVASLANFSTGQDVGWQASLPDLPRSVVLQATADWTFDDGTSNRITGTAWDLPVVKRYAVPGIKTATVKIQHPDGWSLTRTWAAAVTNAQPMAGPLTEGMISFDFDDGYKNELTGAKLLEAAGYRGTFYIVTWWTGGSIALSHADLLTLQNAGHEIGCHTWHHFDLTILDPSAAETEINLARQMLLSWGIRPVSALAYPYNVHNSLTEKLVREAGFALARAEIEESNPDKLYNEKGALNPYFLRGNMVWPTNTVAEVETLIDGALSNKTWLILLFHGIADNDVTATPPAFLQQVIDYTRLKKAKVVTATEGLRLAR